MITIPAYPEFQAELDVFKSDLTFDGKEDYSCRSPRNEGSKPCVSLRMTSARS